MSCNTSLKKKAVKETKTVESSFTDQRDSNTYKIVNIGNRLWMAENLRFKTLNGSWVYNNDTVNERIYGRLYNWKTACKVCPDGWHLPSDSEWKYLEKEIGLTYEIDKQYNRGSKEGLKLKSKTLWNKQGNGNDSYEFNILPAGRFFEEEYAPSESDDYHVYTNGFYELGEIAQFWTSSQDDINYPNHAWFRWFKSDNNSIRRDYTNIPNGLSVRCVKDTLGKTGNRFTSP